MGNLQGSSREPNVELKILKVAYSITNQSIKRDEHTQGIHLG